MSNKVVVWVGAVVAVLLVAVLIGVVVLVNTINAQSEDARYQECMASQGFPAGEIPDVSDEDLVEYSEAAAEAMEFCNR